MHHMYIGDIMMSMARLSSLSMCMFPTGNCIEGSASASMTKIKASMHEKGCACGTCLGHIELLSGPE
jgi:hypothetical protein